MILGIGIDSVDIERFASWHLLPLSSLLRVLSKTEIDYCLSCPAKSAERFAARFAAREALFKAFNSAFAHPKVPFLTICKHITIKKTMQGAPHLIFDYPLSGQKYNIKLSWTHTKTTATAIVCIQNL